MADEIAFENGRISNFEGLVTLTLDRVILHTVAHHSSTSTYTPNFTEIEETSCGRTDVRTFETGFIRSTLSKSRPKQVAHTDRVTALPRPYALDSDLWPINPRRATVMTHTQKLKVQRSVGSKVETNGQRDVRYGTDCFTSPSNAVGKQQILHRWIHCNPRKNTTKQVWRLCTLQIYTRWKVL